MGRGRRFDSKPRSRKKKTGCERRRRDRVQKKRLIGLGMPADLVEKMNTRQVKDLLKYPAKLAHKKADAAEAAAP